MGAGSYSWLGESLRGAWNKWRGPGINRRATGDVAPLGWGLHSLSGGVGWGQLFKELRAEAWFVGHSDFLTIHPTGETG